MASAPRAAPAAGGAAPPARSRRLLAVLLAAFCLCLVVAGRGQTLTASVLIAMALASAVSSIAGFAFSAICGAIVFHLATDQVQLVEAMILCSVANQTLMVWAIRRDVDWRTVSTFLLGGLAGLPLGVWLLLNVARASYVHGLGIFLIAYGGFMLVRRPVVIRRQPVALDVASGFLGGITGGALGFPGAFVTIWCSFKGWSKSRQRAVFQPFILIMQVAALLAITLVHASPGGNPGSDWAGLLCVPGSLIGTALGMEVYRRLSDAHFSMMINILLIVSGVSFAV
ncbi:sulfite exporter TauE/SafE family protein [Methylobacterium crusticola]|nr:sulfite exporter TauE/SafE family protein [Methylobacterium crusticola]